GGVVLAGRALRLRRVDLGPPGADRARGPDGTHDRGRRQLTGTEPVADPAAARGRRMERGRGRHRAVRAWRFDRRACPAPNPRGEQVLAASALDLRRVVVYPTPADNVSRPLPNCLREINQPLISPLIRF